MRSSLASVLVASLLVSSALAGTWNINASFVGEDFLSSWTHEDIADPTDGRVNYVDQATALADNLTFVSSDTLIMRCDDTTVLSADGPGRNSVRLKSNSQWNYHVVIFNVRHMPQGCATWPAAWETNDSDWPGAGEVDVIEGVNDVTPNTISLHVGSTCTMPDSRDESGTPDSNNCDVDTDDNSGCNVANPTNDSYGPDFNAAGGGWYAMERTADEVKVWFWSRSDSSVPSDAATGASTIDTDNWGQPVAYFPNTDCALDDVFSANNIIFDLTLCGSWAGISSVYSAAGCPDTCVDYVNNNPSAFTDAYWDVAGVYVYA
ncbi:glycoside hydrolase family 16 protein [Wolfiporia cocos MD-104 SS10]|uniref:Glycoside hydrolase family 16 protein n=1 Tax=Wolfiporia cocos (strain MD-104) TaxID=742152 RepID=A0A2H3ITD7_WOLCO|nr:glycoside hydrolase family 16 protein [Wolfiporia cocos MD-104 SS10]